MKMRPILFSGSMVRAILEGRKTVTRRVMKRFDDDPGRPQLLRWDPVHGVATFGDSIPDDPCPVDVECSYGAEGDGLYVREAWRTGTSFDGDSPAEIRRKAVDVSYSNAWAPLKYEADGHMVGVGFLGDFGGEWGRLRQGMHILREFSRIDLEIVNVRPERLHEITEEDAKAEGVQPLEHVSPRQPLAGEGIPTEPQPHRIAFGSLWDEINGDRKDGIYRWIRNVWLWRIEFGRIE